ncbi:hypothetical protein [Erwinia persicina]|uniref:Uncharacterized protein n=1 Tax=Erwinia persicina TaxID=55211 RepID=A0A4U3ETC8_9GAMM|nr:hypothetical protein [Erwinia persicina]MBD8109125.1 hypothetical protein [Erwinia persicina]MBD8170097.1 hypothetical protein [Erwinia persicina]MBD8212249.1 hypothetical protein [Erwinia persicina]TKJ83644.1 hypothetical protein EpCFBP13511_22520 [Erwinia persicina]
MPYFNELNEKETRSKETESGNADQVHQQVSQGGAGVSPSYGRGVQPASSDNDRLFPFITEERLQEAQEFRRKGYNSHVPEVDPGLMTQLREALAVTQSRLCIQAGVVGPLGSLWLLEQVDKITRLTGRLSDGVIKSWIEQELPGKSGGETELGSRRTAQSLARRLESTLQTLIRVVHTLRTIDDYSTPEKRHDMLVDELTGAFSYGDKSTVIQALNRMTTETSGHAAWISLMQTRAAAWETGKPVIVNAMTETSRHEAEKANKKARVLQGASQAFFGDVAAYLQGLSSDLAKASINASQNASSPAMPLVNNDGAAAPLLRSNSLTQRIRTGVNKYKLKAQTAVAGMKGPARSLVRITKHGHLTATPTKDPEHVVADSITRSILWQWQQPAINIQYASAALLSKVDELEKIEGILASGAVADSRESEQESLSHPGEDDIGAQVREWVSHSIEQENPENQLATKVATLERLLGGDIDHAQSVLARLGNTTESIQKGLERQLLSVNDMLQTQQPVDVARSMWATIDNLVDKFMPDMARTLAKAANALNEALSAAGNPARNFSRASAQAGKAQLLATKVKESLSAESARLTERPLDEHSRGSRLAKHWANLAKTQSVGNYPVPDAEQVLSSLQERGLLTGILSTGDPAGYLFATRLAGELENARNDELRLPMSPDHYTALEKGLVEYIVKWAQRKTSKGVSRIVIELSFEHALDTVSFNVSSLLRLPYKVLKASIKIPYKVNKVNNYTMPGQDKPYKAIYGLLGKKLKQLGFNLLTAPVPGMVKFAGGAWVTAGATLHNLHTDSREKTFSAVYQHVAEGKQSEKIKMNSVKEMIFDSVTDTASTAAFKGAGRAWKSWKSKNNFFSDKDFVSDHFTEIDGETYSQAQQGGMAGDSDNPAWGNQQSRAEISRPTVTEGENLSREAESLTGGLKSDNTVHPDENNGGSESDGDRKSHRRKRAVAEEKTNITRSDFDRLVDNRPYSELPDNVKKSTYFYGIKYLLRQIENDESLPQQVRNNAYLARIGAKLLVPVDIAGHQLNNTIFLPDGPGQKSGVLIRLDSEVPYLYISKGEDLPENIKWAMPITAKNPTRGRKLGFTFTGIGIVHGDGPSVMEQLKYIRSGKLSFKENFNVNNPEPMDIASLSDNIASAMEADYKSRNATITNSLLTSRAAAGAYIPDPDVTVTEAKYHLEFTWENLTPAEYLRSFSRPFETLAGQVQLIFSDAEGQSIQQTEQSVVRAQYTGAWIDASAGAVTSLSGAGIVFGMAQSAAEIAADVAEGKDPDPLMVAGLVIGCIPGGKIATRVGKFSKIGGKSVKYLMMIGNKTIDLAIVGKSIKSAVESGEPLEIYQALLASGMSVKNSYDMARDISSKLEMRKTMGESASLEALEAVYNNIPDYSLSSTMTERTFKIGQTDMLGRINNGEIEISRNNGATWQKGSKVHLLAYRLQNAGGKSRLPDQPRAGSSSSSEPSLGNSLLVAEKNRYLPGGNLQNTRNTPPEGQVKRFGFFGKKFMGRIRNHNFEISSDGGDTWKSGNMLHKIRWQAAPAGELSVKELDKKIDRASVEEGPGSYSNICYGTAIRNAGQAEVITPKQTDWLLNKIAKKDSKGEVMGSDHYRQAFGLQKKIPLSSFSSAGITESGFLHVGERRKDGTVVYDHVAYVHVTDQGTYIYQANGADFLLALNGPESMQKYNNIGSHVSKSHYKHLMDETIITRFNDYFAEAEQDGSQAVFTFTPASEVQENYARIMHPGSVVSETDSSSSNNSGAKSMKKLTREPVLAKSRNPARSIEPIIEPRSFKLLEGEEALTSKTSTLLKTTLGQQYHTYLSSPRENCANAAVEVAKTLRKNDYTDVHIMELGIWPNGGENTMPTNHYVVMATKDGINISVDLTAGQFEQYGFYGPIISSTDNWIHTWQNNLRNTPRTLVKMAPLSGGITTSPFSMDFTNSQLTVPNGTLLQRPAWYK